jgi:hypothetical protein
MGPDCILKNAKSFFPLAKSVKLTRNGDLAIHDGEDNCLSRLDGVDLDSWPSGVSEWPPRMDEWIEATSTDLGKFGFAFDGERPVFCQIVQVRLAIDGICFRVVGKGVESYDSVTVEKAFVPKYATEQSIENRFSELDSIKVAVETERERLVTLEKLLSRRIKKSIGSESKS